MIKAPRLPGWITSPVNPCHGIQLRENADGTAVLFVHAAADADKRSQDWRETKRKEFTSEADFKQEIDIEFNAKSGALIFPEFDESVHVVLPDRIPKRLCCYCSIDPHPRTPTAVLWLGVDEWHDLWIYRELWPSKAYGLDRNLRDTDEENNYTFWEVADAIAYLEGNKLEWKNRGTDNEYAIYRQQERGERIVDRYMDQAAKGFDAQRDEDSRTSIAESFRTYGIHCQDPYKQHQAGYDEIHRVLAMRHHSRYGQWPMLHISSDCRETILELKKLRYKERKTQLEDEELWQRGVKARRHMVDNVRYILTSKPTWVDRLASYRHVLQAAA